MYVCAMIVGLDEVVVVVRAQVRGAFLGSRSRPRSPGLPLLGLSPLTSPLLICHKNVELGIIIVSRQIQCSVYLY